MRSRIWTLTGCALAAATLSTAALADVGWGAGLTWTFGGPKPVSGPALGVDYSFADRSLRPNVGVAYLGKDNIYLGGDVGYSFGQQGLNFGLGAGYVDTRKK